MTHLGVCVNIRGNQQSVGTVSSIVVRRFPYLIGDIILSSIIHIVVVVVLLLLLWLFSCIFRCHSF